MSIKLLPAPVNPVDPSLALDASTSLVPLPQRAISTRAGQISLVPSADASAWSSSTRRGGPTRIAGTPVEDSQSDAAGRSAWEYVSGWAWSQSVERTAIAHYLSYAAGAAGWSGQLINLYA
ncbi:MAG: hypothetical protein ABSF59_08820 [Candidatus Sulfotelmatobacter sp.]|jgi:hypothetical protein